MGEQMVVQLAMIVKVVMIQVVEVVATTQSMAVMLVVVVMSPQFAFFFLHRDAGPIAHELIRPRKGVEQRRLSRIWVSS
jgi:hypothetical protein